MPLNSLGNPLFKNKINYEMLCSLCLSYQSINNIGASNLERPSTGSIKFHYNYHTYECIILLLLGTLLNNWTSISVVHFEFSSEFNATSTQFINYYEVQCNLQRGNQIWLFLIKKKNSYHRKHRASSSHQPSTLSTSLSSSSSSVGQTGKRLGAPGHGYYKL